MYCIQPMPCVSRNGTYSKVKLLLEESGAWDRTEGIIPFHFKFKVLYTTNLVHVHIDAERRPFSDWIWVGYGIKYGYDSDMDLDLAPSQGYKYRTQGWILLLLFLLLFIDLMTMTMI